MTDEIRIDLKFDAHQPPCDHSPKGGTLERIGAHDYVCRSCWKLFKVGVMAKEVRDG